MLIPKIIHYCWFGNNKKPKKIEKCIDSWKKYLPDYKFMEWNEQNFNIHSDKYVEQAYNNKKYAFVSDVARIKALKQYGGIYMDTDVMVYKNFDDLLNTADCILGFEYENWVATSFIACVKNHSLLDDFQQMYAKESFVKSDNSLNIVTNVVRFTNLLETYGLQRENKKQSLKDNIIVYPIEYFSPYDYANCVMERTENSYCAHLFFVTWLPKSAQIKKMIKKVSVKIIGKNGIETVRKKVKPYF